VKPKDLLLTGAALAALLLATPASAQQWNTENVRVDQPFGDIDISMAEQDFTSFWSGLSEEQRVEFPARCEVIRSSETYESSHKALCANPMTAESTLPGGGETTGATGSINQDGAGDGTSAAEPSTDAGGAAAGAGGADNSSGGSAQ
jgi:hypothetical protein